jgi:hypothetical protein
VIGVPIAPMTSGAQPCMPTAPWSAEKARTSQRTIAGRIGAICWGDEAADAEAEQICLAELHGGEERDGVARHLLDDVGGGAGEAADSGVAERHDPPLPRRERADQGRGPVVEIAAEVLEQDQRHRAFAAGIAVDVADAVGVTDPAVWKLRISPGYGCSPSPFVWFPDVRRPGERDRADTGRDKTTPARPGTGACGTAARVSRGELTGAERA